MSLVLVLNACVVVFFVEHARKMFSQGQIAELRQLLAQARPRVEALDLKAFRARLPPVLSGPPRRDRGRPQEGLWCQTQEERSRSTPSIGAGDRAACVADAADLHALKSGNVAVNARVRRLSAEAVERACRRRWKNRRAREPDSRRLKIAMLHGWPALGLTAPRALFGSERVDGASIRGAGTWDLTTRGA